MSASFLWGGAPNTAGGSAWKHRETTTNVELQVNRSHSVRWPYRTDMASQGKDEEVEHVTLPELDYPFRSAVSEHADEIHQGTAEWAVRLGLLPDEKARLLFGATGLGRLVARTHPDSSLEDLKLISDWYAWLFLQDDMRDEAEVGKRPSELSEIDACFLDLLRGDEPVPCDIPLAWALHDLSRRLRARLRENGLSDVWMRRLVRAVGEHLEATLWEAANRARDVAPDPETYVRMRPLTGGLSIVTEIVEIVEGTHLPTEVREHPIVGRMTGASHNVVCWANDILSLGKELGRGEVNNLVVVLRDAYGIPLQEAVDRAAEMHDDEVRAFVELSGRLPHFGPTIDANLGRYVSALRTRMRGVLDWSRESERYRAAAGDPTPLAGVPTTVARRR